MTLQRKAHFVSGQDVKRLVLEYPLADGTDEAAAVADPVEAGRRVPPAEEVWVVVEQVVLVRHLALIVVPCVEPAEMKFQDVPLVLIALDVDVILAIYGEDMVDRRIVPPAAPFGPAPVLDHVMALAPQEPVLVVAPERMREVAQLLELAPRVKTRIDKPSVLLDRVEKPVDRYIRDYVRPLVDWNVVFPFFHTEYIYLGMERRRQLK